MTVNLAQTLPIHHGRRAAARSHETFHGQLGQRTDLSAPGGAQAHVLPRSEGESSACEGHVQSNSDGPMRKDDSCDCQSDH